MLDCAQEPRLHLRDAVGPVDRHRRPDHPGGEGARSSSTARDEVIKVESQYLEGAITNGERYNKVIAIWSEATEKIANAMFSEMEEHRQGRPAASTRSTSWPTPARAASKQQIRQLAGMRGLMAKPSGEIIETPITSNFREGLDGAAVLHLDARRAQGSGRHGAQDGRLGLPDAPSRRRRAGRDHPRDRLRHAGRHRGAGHRRERARSSSRCATASSAASTLEQIIDPFTGETIVDVNEDDGRGDVVGDSGRRHREGEDPLGADLRVAPRRVREVLRPRPRHRQDGRARPGGRRHRGAVDRRAGHAADDAHVPHRRHGVARLRAVDARSAQRRHGPVPGHAGRRRRRTATWSS